MPLCWLSKGFSLLFTKLMKPTFLSLGASYLGESQNHRASALKWALRWFGRMLSFFSYTNWGPSNILFTSSLNLTYSSKVLFILSCIFYLLTPKFEAPEDQRLYVPSPTTACSTEPKITVYTDPSISISKPTKLGNTFLEKMLWSLRSLPTPWYWIFSYSWKK